ncbi:MerR family transcriptional regulator [bacterium]|nr:MerR family transcriptional regulator [bacterium]
MDYGHPIRLVALRTGLSPHLIRMWERRYGAVRPERTETGRRVYSDEDIRRLSLLRQATLIGESIGQIANLNGDELARLVADAKGTIPSSAPASPADRTGATYHRELCLEAIRNMDSVNLELRLLTASVAMGQQPFLEDVLQPLLHRIGEEWRDGNMKVAHEHVASAVIRSLLGTMFVNSRTNSTGPLLISGTPAGQIHEFGALMASVTAAANGWRTVYLGPNLPAEDIADAVARHQPDAVALSIVYPSDDARIPIELRKLARLIDRDIPLLIGGRSSEAYAEVIREIEAEVITDLTDLRHRLALLRSRHDENKVG